MKMTMCHSIELIGYQIQAHWQNNCTVLITRINHQKCVSIFRYSDWLFFNLSVKFEEQRICDGHGINDHHRWNIINFKNPRHTFISQHLRNVQAKFHRNLPNCSTLLIHLFDWTTHGHLQFSFMELKKLKSTFIKLSNEFALLSFKMAHIQIFFPRGHGRTPVKVRSNLKESGTLIGSYEWLIWFSL